MPDYEAIYRDHAEAYDRMVLAEDCDGELERLLQQLLPVQAARVVEVGVGTGRVTEILLRAGCHVTGFEPAPAMLDVARRRLAHFDSAQWSLLDGDGRRLPLEDGCADVAIAGWVYGHMTHWEADRWREAIEQAVGEMERVVRSGGVSIVLETLGTGREQAAPPNEKLAGYYELLEQRGYDRHVVRTDYQFESPEAAVEGTAFFFGEALAKRILENRWTRIPEHTGVWRRVL